MDRRRRNTLEKSFAGVHSEFTAKTDKIGRNTLEAYVMVHRVF